MTVDVEDWFQVGAFETVIGRTDWDQCEHRFAANTHRVLDLFGRHRVRATFFVLGWVAERSPSLLRRIAEEGHEVASHGYDHQRVFLMTPDQFRSDLKKSRYFIEKASGCVVSGYRAPSFSIDHRTPWAHAILAEEGYSYSSSVAPIVHDHYGWPDAPRFAYRPLADHALVELPVSTAVLAGRRISAAGGGFFRLLPFAVSHWAISQINRDGEAAMTYFHPWEVDPEQPRIDAPLKSRLRHYTGLGGMEAKLSRLLSAFRWDGMDRLVEAKRQAPLPVWDGAAATRVQGA